ncbi:hypothetical protein J2Z79_001125 [Symbiobacterium terraclitae]|uniref:Cell wall-active antibiotics response LiaF-like C-terminal domain-containing protein n=1 Tax=Symbiobacterium terraclitae TaxID=557451 RepID=A0ABS4JQF2_9FIRM|nr:cell wall-active antibiotics response protein LiaF [Symbiobacterium terraclitae]MBP2017740.1 hypothetical protein [Symbiobacterium terraclitae]
MRHRGILVLFVILLFWLCAALIRLDPVRTGAGLLLVWGGYRLLRAAPEGAHLPSGGWTLFGTVQRMRDQYVLEGFALACGVADVKMDLARAIVPEGEHVITVRAVLGDVSLYLPDDLPVDVVASVGAGSLHVPGQSLRGIGRRGVYSAEGVGNPDARLRIVVALGAGDVDVRRI